MSLEPRPERAGVSEIIGAALITLVQIPIALVFEIILTFLSMGIGACAEPSCSTAIVIEAAFLPVQVGAVTLVTSIVLIIVWARRGRTLWPAPVLGLALIIVAFVVAVIINHFSFAFSR